MAATEDPFAYARQRMIDGQIRPERVRHPFILAAMAALPRERFVPPRDADIAYADREIPLGHGRALREPRVTARLLQAAAPHRGERAIVIAAGTGYAAALLSRLGLEVIAVEGNDALRKAGEAACAAVGAAVTWQADATLPPSNTYDLVLIDGGVEFVPDAIAGAVAPRTGRLATILVAPDAPGRAVIGEHTGAELRLREVFDANASILDGFRTERSFVF